MIALEEALRQGKIKDLENSLGAVRNGNLSPFCWGLRAKAEEQGKLKELYDATRQGLLSLETSTYDLNSTTLLIALETLETLKKQLKKRAGKKDATYKERISAIVLDRISKGEVYQTQCVKVMREYGYPIQVS